MPIFNFFRRKKVDDEIDQRALLLRTGRVAEGSIFDVATDESGTESQIFYHYEANGVVYESSQTLDDEQRSRPDDYLPGARIVVRYDPRQPGNSVVV